MNATRVHAFPASYVQSVRNRIRRSSVAAENGCIEWTGASDRYGYGAMKVTNQDGDRKNTGTHRAAWIAFVGPIEGDLTIEHLCRNRKCVNVNHMELVTNAENARRQDHSRKKGRSGRRALKVACVNGHTFTDETTAWYRARDGYMRRVCIPCRNLSNARRPKKRAA